MAALKPGPITDSNDWRQLKAEQLGRRRETALLVQEAQGVLEDLPLLAFIEAGGGCMHR